MSDSQVKIWNRNNLPYEEKYRGKLIHIEPGKCIEMEYDQAVLFLGNFAGIATGNDDCLEPSTFKKLEMDKKDKKRIFESRANLDDSKDKERIFVCQACGKEFLTKKGLEKHTKDKHMSEMADKEAMKEMHDREDI